MPTARPFAYNTGSTLPNTAQYGNIAVLTGETRPGGVDWWNGPDEDLGYVIATINALGNQPNPLNVPAYIQFYRTKVFSDTAFTNLANFVTKQNFASASAAKDYLFANGYWTSYTGSTVTFTPKVEVFYDSSFYINSDGVAYAWGYNGFGELGDNTFINKCTPIAVCGGLTFSQISPGQYHILGLTTTGIAYGWGHSNNNADIIIDSDAIGTNVVNQTVYLTPVAVCGGLTFSKLSGGQNFSLGLTTEGIGYGWGQNYNSDIRIGGQLGINTQTNKMTPVAVCGGLTFSQISAGFNHSLGITTNGTLYAWGVNDSGQLGINSTVEKLTPVAVCGGLTFSQVNAGNGFSLGITTTGIAYAWGINDLGQLGINSIVQKLTPVAVCGGLTFSQISAGNYHSLGITTTGIAYAWGLATNGALGNNSGIIDRSTPVAVCGGLTFSQVSAGNQVSLGITTTNVVYGWGTNSFGQVGDNTTVDRLTPVAVCVI